LEENVVNYVLGLSKNASKAIAFDELMGSNAQA
jgi:trigger factor